MLKNVCMPSNLICLKMNRYVAQSKFLKEFLVKLEFIKLIVKLNSLIEIMIQMWKNLSVKNYTSNVENLTF